MLVDGSAPVVGDMQLTVTVGAVVPLEVFTIRYALAVLGAHNGNKSTAATALGVSRHALGRLVKRAKLLGVG